MKKIFLILSVLMLSEESSIAQPADIRQVLIEDVKAMQNDLIEANGKIIRIKQDKVNIENDLKSMEQWGLNEQAEKFKYYEENLEIKEQLASADAKIDAEKKAHLKTIDKYNRIKSFMGYLAGAFLALLYVKFGSSIVSVLALAGPWGPVIHLLGPFGAFAAGYILIKFYF
jgi:hypothetical protein